MQFAPIIVSALALAASLFTFYWINLREKRALYLVRIDKLGHFGDFHFALVNSGKKDVLLTAVAPYFEGSEKGSSFYPAARIIARDATTDLLAGGKAVEYRIEFPEPFTESFAQLGAKRAEWPDFHSHFLGIEVAWVEMTGAVHCARVLHSVVGFEASGKLRGIAPMTQKNAKYELYHAAA